MVLGRIEGMVTTDMAEAVKGCTYCVETIQEKLDYKRELIAALQAADPELIIGSNTGSMTMDTLAEGMPRPDRLIGIHYFNPAHIIPLVEVHRGTACSDATYEETERMMKASGKKTALVRKEMPGFIVNRVMGAITREIAFILDEGICTPEDLNTADQVQHRLPLRLPGAHGSGRHDRPRHLRHGLRAGVPGAEQRDRAIAPGGREGGEGRTGHQVRQGLVRLQRQDARRGPGREEPRPAAAS